MLSLPSEKVPAPPSPNWTLDSSFKTPASKNLETVFTLLSTSSPLSITIGLILLEAKMYAANNPAGPLPTITIFLSLFSIFTGKTYSLFSDIEISFFNIIT